jgi:membrane-associated phospholipid phosphatase
LVQTEDRSGEGGSRYASLLSALTTPYLTSPLFILFAGLYFVRGLQEVAVYGVVAVGFTVVIPLGYAEHLRRRGAVDSVHIYDQHARLGPLALTGVCSLAGFGILYGIGAPVGILRLGAMLFLTAGGVLAATFFLKISGHVSAWTVGSTVLVLLWGPLTSPLFVGAVPIAWSRLALGKHTTVEVVVGFFYGVGIALGFAWLVGLL